MHDFGILAIDTYLDARFFQALAGGGRLRRLTELDFASWKFPKAGEGHALRTQPDEKMVVMLDDRDGDFGDFVSLGRRHGERSVRFVGFEQAARRAHDVVARVDVHQFPRDAV